MRCEVCLKTPFEKARFFYTHYKEMKNCVICGKEGELSHHISYHPPLIIKLCRSCHNKLHFSKQDFYPWLKPKDSLKYSGGKLLYFNSYIWLCSDCYRKTTKEIPYTVSDKK